MLLVYCRRCKQELSRYGAVAEIVYEHVCEHYALKNSAVVMDQKELNGICCRKPVVDFLEKKGYVVTTEAGKNMIGIKPTHHMNIGDDIKMYCRGHK